MRQLPPQPGTLSKSPANNNNIATKTESSVLSSPRQQSTTTTVVSAPPYERIRSSSTAKDAGRPRPENPSRVLESVSSLKDYHSGSITEIKVWSSTLPPTTTTTNTPTRTTSTASPPVVEPVSSQSSTSDDSSKERPRYRLSKKQTTPDLKRTPSSPGSKDVIIQTVSSLRDVASASLSDLKEWAHNHTRSDPIPPISSSSSSCESMVEQSKPPHEAAAAASERVVHTIKPPSLAGSDRQDGATTAAASQGNNRYALAETVSSFRDVANETMSGIREWAAKLPKKQETVEQNAADESIKLYSKQLGEFTSSPKRATRTLYGAETGYQSTMEQFDDTNVAPSNKRKLPCSPQLKLVQDLVSPFLVCSKGGGGVAQTVSPEEEVDYSDGNCDEDGDEPRTYHIDLSAKSQTKESTRESAWSTWNPLIGALDRRAESFDESLLTYDSEAEEQEQIRRMTSWGTIGTMGTQNTMLTMDTARTLETADGTMVEATMMVQDDNGNKINPVLLEKAKKHREQRKLKGRKRLVKFDYPPISSLRECPRTDPEDLPNLFFTEEELDQIEDDRFNTKIADDVEIVCISSIKSGDDSLSDVRDVDLSASRSSLSAGSFSRYTSTPRLRGKQRSKPPFLVRKRSGSGEDTHGLLDRDRKSPTPPRKFPNDSTSNQKDKRLIKGVQIFLRERSINSVS